MPVSQALQVLSPFDNQVIQRKRLCELFTFDYSIECYVPESKRQFGYFYLRPALEEFAKFNRCERLKEGFRSPRASSSHPIPKKPTESI